MSVGKKSSSPPPSRRREEVAEVEGTEDGGDGAVVQQKESSGGKKAGAARYGRCFSGLELNVGPGPLKDVYAGKLKGQIRRWARAVVAYARQLSFGSPRSSSSSRLSSDGGTTARSATFPSKAKSKSGLGGAKGDPAEPPP